MKTASWEAIDLAGLLPVARQVASHLTANDARLLLLYGEMGAGKTTIVRTLCTALGAHGDAVSSPTFSIINEYRTAKNEPIFHIDLYRLKSIEEALNIGIEEYIHHPKAWCFIEWPQLVEHLLSENTATLDIKIVGETKRFFNLKY